MIPALPSEESQRNCPWYLWPNLLGLDAPLVAVSWAWLYARLQHADLPVVLYLVLAGAVWVIYMADRLADVCYLKTERASFSPRHAFVRRRFVLIVFAVFAVAGFCFYGAGWLIPEAIWTLGLWLGGATLVYQLLVWSPRRKWAAVLLRILLAATLGLACAISGLPVWLKVAYGCLLLGLVLLSANSPKDARRIEPPKEAVAGLLFALGSIFPATYYTPGSFTAISFGQVCVLWALCALNCLSISWVERHLDRQGDPAALPQRVGYAAGIVPLGLVLGMVLCGVFWQAQDSGGGFFYLFAALSMALLLALWSRRESISRDLFRTLADAALLTPALFFLVSAWT